VSSKLRIRRGCIFKEAMRCLCHTTPTRQVAPPTPLPTGAGSIYPKAIKLSHFSRVVPDQSKHSGIAAAI